MSTKTSSRKPGLRDLSRKPTTSPKAGTPAHESKAQRDRMEPTCFIEELRPLEEVLRGRIIGQKDAIDSLICSFSRLLSGLRDPSRPLLTALLLGPTGVGKTETAKALAQTLFGSERAMTRVNCEEYAHSHEISKLLGSPPGYVGHDIEPILSQQRIDEPHQLFRAEAIENPGEHGGMVERIHAGHKDEYVSIVLFDEIEKAHPSLWNALLGILEDGMLTLGDNTTTDFTRSIILMTSNVGSREMGEFLEHRPVGFQMRTEEETGPAGLTDLALTAATKEFPFEFINRFDEMLIYSSLNRGHLGQIFDKFLSDIHDRAIRRAGVPVLIKVSDDAKNHIIDEGTDLRFGARPLRRAIERELVDPLSRLIASKKLTPGDVVEVELEDGTPAFYRTLMDSGALVS